MYRLLSPTDRLIKIDNAIPLVQNCIQAIGQSHSEVVSIVEVWDAYHAFRYKIIMDDALTLSAHKYHSEDFAYLFKALIQFGLKISHCKYQLFQRPHNINVLFHSCWKTENHHTLQGNQNLMKLSNWSCIHLWKIADQFS